MKQKILLSIGASVLVLSGCANDYVVVYDSLPQGAQLVCEGVNKGYTPVELAYPPVGKEDKDRGQYTTAPCYAQWASGYRQHYDHSYDLSRFPYGARQTVSRPTDDHQAWLYDKQVEYRIMQQRMENARVRALTSSVNRLSYQLSQPQKVNVHHQGTVNHHLNGTVNVNPYQGMINTQPTSRVQWHNVHW